MSDTAVAATTAGAPRERLLDRLDRLPPGSVAVIVAPTGYGSSTLLRTWASTRPRVAVVSVRSPADDPLRAVTAALGAAGPTAEAIGEALEARSATLAIDDVHLLRDRTSLEVVGQVARGLRRGRLVLVGRTRPAIGLAALAVRSRLHEIAEDELRFDDTEVREVLRSLGADDADASLADLARRLEGWPAAVVLLGLAGARGGRVELDLRRDLEDYVQHIVREELDDELTQLLAEVAVLGRVHERDVVEVTGRSGTDVLLAELAGRGLFLEPVAGRSGWWRLRELVRDALSPAAGALDGARADDLRRRAAARWAGSGNADVVIEMLLEHRDPHLVLDVMASAATDRATRALLYQAWRPPAVRRLNDLLAQVPLAPLGSDLPRLVVLLGFAAPSRDLARSVRIRTAISAHVDWEAPGVPPFLQLLDAHVALQLGHLDRAAAATARAHGSMAPGSSHAALEHHLHLLDAHIALYAGDLPGAARSALAALEPGRPHHQLMEVETQCLLGMVALRTGDVAEARRRLELADATFGAEAQGETASLYPWLRITLLAHDDRLEEARAAGVEVLRDPAFELRTSADLVPVLALARVERRLGMDVSADERLERVAPLVARCSGAHLLVELVAECRGSSDPTLRPSAAGPADAELTSAERRVAAHLTGRMTLDEIARELGVSINTVKTQTRTVYRKLGVTSRRAAAALLDAT